SGFERDCGCRGRFQQVHAERAEAGELSHLSSSKRMVSMLNLFPLNSDMMIAMALRSMSATAKARSNGTPLCTSHNASRNGVCVSLFLAPPDRPPRPACRSAPRHPSSPLRDLYRPAAGSDLRLAACS